MKPGRHELGEIFSKVNLYLNVNRFDAAEKLLKATLSDYGSLANVHNLLGVTYHKQSKFPEAIVEFNSALKTNPEFVEAALNLAATLCDLSRYEDARKVFAKLKSQVNPRKKQPSLVLGRLADRHAKNGQAYEESGMHAEAIQEYKKAINLFPNLPDVQLALAKLYIEVDQFNKARTEFEEIIKLYPELGEAHAWLGILYFKQGRKDQAKRHWEQAQQANPNDLSARAFIKISRDWPAEHIRQ